MLFNILFFSINSFFAQRIVDKSLAGRYVCTENNDFVILSEDGTGERSINNIYCKIGESRFSWVNDKEKIFFFTGSYELREYDSLIGLCFWFVENGTIKLMVPTPCGLDFYFNKVN